MSPLSQIIMNIYVKIYQRIRTKADRYRDGAKIMSDEILRDR